VQVWNDYITNDPDYNIMRSRFTEPFYNMYNLGFKEYEQGDWEEAKKFFNMSKVK
jgi:hypothetical protein